MTIITLAVAAMLFAAGGDDPAPSAGEITDPAVLHFSIRDDEGRLVPGRLTFLGPDGPGAPLFPNPDAAPNDLALRDNIVYCLSGEHRITVPPGTYEVFASRGLEWSIDSTTLMLAAGEETSWTATLRHEVDTSGWVSGDFHLHTLTNSGHGDANMPERIISIVGEGLEFAVATDHNHHTDYGPTIETLSAQEHLTDVPGNEVSTSIGHFNAWPLRAGGPVINHGETDARKLFALIRVHDNGLGVRPVVQVNHPRWRRIDYFGLTGLDPVTGTSDDPRWSDQFDSVELFNENEGWGFYDADVRRDLSMGRSIHSVLRDWYTLLDRGRRVAAVGNSDSHTVRNAYAGWPRNYMPSATDDPGAIDPVEIAEAVKAMRVFTTLGPFVEFTVDGSGMGETVSAEDGTVLVEARVQAASWIDCDRLEVVVNGDVAAEMSWSRDTGDGEPLDISPKILVAVPRDAWITLVVSGDKALAPVVHDGSRPILPISVTNPVFVDADGDGHWTPPAEQAAMVVAGAHGDPAKILVAMAARGPEEAAWLVLKAADENPATTRAVTLAALRHDGRRVRLAGCRVAEGLEPDEALVEALAVASEEAGDPYLALSAMRALGPGSDGMDHLFSAWLDRWGTGALNRYAHEALALVPGAAIDEWLAIGYFPGDHGDLLTAVDHGPEADENPGASFAGKSGEVSWRPLAVRSNGYLNLLDLDEGATQHEQAIAYAQAWLWSPEARDVWYMMGTDDGCQLKVNGQLLWQDTDTHEASPTQRIATMPLAAGWNRLLVKVANGNGAFGLYFRVLDEEIRSAAAIP